MQITIDGPASVGKSTVSFGVAQALNFTYIDTGAVYRALAWAALENHIPLEDGEKLAHLASKIKLEITSPFIDDGRQYTVLADGQDITWKIRSPEVEHHVSEVSTHREVRRALLDIQRELGNHLGQSGVVMAGRDAGTRVLPNAEIKVYLTALAETQAKRRFLQLQSTDHSKDISYDILLEEIKRRDKLDAMQMKPAEDAWIIATDTRSAEEITAMIVERAHERL